MNALESYSGSQSEISQPSLGERGNQSAQSESLTLARSNTLTRKSRTYVSMLTAGRASMVNQNALVSESQIDSS
jgi:hypothetical protein